MVRCHPCTYVHSQVALENFTIIHTWIMPIVFTGSQPTLLVFTGSPTNHCWFSQAHQQPIKVIQIASKAPQMSWYIRYTQTNWKTNLICCWRPMKSGFLLPWNKSLRTLNEEDASWSSDWSHSTLYFSLLNDVLLSFSLSHARPLLFWSFYLYLYISPWF